MAPQPPQIEWTGVTQVYAPNGLMAKQWFDVRTAVTNADPAYALSIAGFAGTLGYGGVSTVPGDPSASSCVSDDGDFELTRVTFNDTRIEIGKEKASGAWVAVHGELSSEEMWRHVASCVQELPKPVT